MVISLLFNLIIMNFSFSSSSQDLDIIDLIERDAKNKQLLILDLILEQLPSAAQCHHAPGAVCVLQVEAARPYPVLHSELAYGLHSCLNRVLCLRMCPVLKKGGWREVLYCGSSVPHECSKFMSLQLLVERPLEDQHSWGNPTMSPPSRGVRQEI